MATGSIFDSSSGELLEGRVGIIVNPRGASGSGKTELVRRILADYGWRPDAAVAGVEPIWRAGRVRPFGYRLAHPWGGRPLVVVGHYEVTSGGCDTIRAVDGGLDEAIRRAGDYAADGHDVIIEGLQLSREYQRSAALARSHPMHVLRLATPCEQCARNLVWRRRARRDSWPALAETAAREHASVAEACTHLEGHAAVEVLPFEQALIRARDLLGLRSPRESDPSHGGAFL